MSIKKIKIIPLVLCIVIVLAQNIVCFASYDSTKYPVASGEYTANFFMTSNNGQIEYELYRTVGGNSEIVGYLEKKNGINSYRFMSLDAFTIYTYGSFKNLVYGTSGTNNKSMNSLSNGDFYYVDGSEFPISEYTTPGSQNEVLYNSMYIFDSSGSAYKYLKNGDMSGLLYNKSKTYDSENIYLENFRVIYHDSNNLDNCYVEIKYDLSEYIVNNIDEAILQLDYEYDLEGQNSNNLIEIDYSGESATGVISIDLNYHSTGYDFYIKDIYNTQGWFKDYVVKEAMLGDEFIVNFDDIKWRINRSSLYMNFTPVIGAECGMQNNAQVDLLNPSNTSFYSSTPDTSGNYTTNNDYQQGDGYYTTIVGQDGQGNPTYNYYYYDNSKHYSYEIDPDSDVDIDTDIPIGGGGSSGNSDGVITILWGNALEVEGNIDLNSNLGGGSGGSGGSGGDSDVDVNIGDNVDVVIEDDDYTDTALREDLKDGFGLFDDTSTDTKADGYLNMAASFFNNIDPELQDILTFGISSVVVIGILRSALKR